MKIILLAGALLFSISSLTQGGKESIGRATLEEMVKDYQVLFQLKQYQTDVFEVHPGQCKADRRSCIEAVCDKMSRWDCDDNSELRRVAETCRGNYNGKCINYIASKVHSQKLNDWNELRPVVESCRGNYEEDCIKSICDRLSKFECDEVSELTQIARACGNSH